MQFSYQVLFYLKYLPFTSSGNAGFIAFLSSFFSTSFSKTFITSVPISNIYSDFCLSLRISIPALHFRYSHLRSAVILS